MRARAPGRQPVADRIATGALLAFFGRRPGALARIEPVGLDLPERGHYGPAGVIGFVLRFEMAPVVTLNLSPTARITFNTVANSGFPSVESAL